MWAVVGWPFIDDADEILVSPLGVAAAVACVLSRALVSSRLDLAPVHVAGLHATTPAPAAIDGAEEAFGNRTEIRDDRGSLRCCQT